jgi:adenylosuccinate lyase
MVLSLIASTLDKFATEIRHLQRTEVREVKSFRGPERVLCHTAQTQSILSENIAGLARLVGHMHPLPENIPLWHERDMSSSVGE